MDSRSLKINNDTNKTTVRASTSWLTTVLIILMLFPMITILGWLLDKVYRKQTLFPQAIFHPEYWIDKLLSRLPGCIATCCRACRVDEEAPVEKKRREKCSHGSRKTDSRNELKPPKKIKCTVPAEKPIPFPKKPECEIKPDRTQHDELSCSESPPCERRIERDSCSQSSMESPKVDQKIDKYPCGQLTSSESSQHVLKGGKGDQFESSESDIQKCKKEQNKCEYRESYLSFPKNDRHICIKLWSSESDIMQKEDKDVCGYNKEMKESAHKTVKHIPCKVLSSDSDTRIYPKDKVKRSCHDSDTQIYPKDKGKRGCHDSEPQIYPKDKVKRSCHKDLKKSVPQFESDCDIRNKDKDICGSQEDIERRDEDENDDERKVLPQDLGEPSEETLASVRKKCHSCKKVYKAHHVPNEGCNIRHHSKPRSHTLPQQKIRKCSTDPLMDERKEKTTRRKCHGSKPKVSEKRKECLTDTDPSTESSLTIKSKCPSMQRYRSVASNTTTESTADSVCTKPPETKTPTIKSCLKKPKREASADLPVKSCSKKSHKLEKCESTESTVSSQELREKSTTKKSTSKNKQYCSATSLRKSKSKKPISNESQRCSKTSLKKSKTKTKKPSSMNKIRSSMTNLRDLSQSSLCSCKSTLSKVTMKSLTPSTYLGCAKKKLDPRRWYPPRRVDPSLLPKPIIPKSFTKSIECASKHRMPCSSIASKFGIFFKSKHSCQPKTKKKESFFSSISSTISDSLSDVCEMQNRYLEKLRCLNRKNKTQELWRKITKRKSDPFCDFFHKFLP